MRPGLHPEADVDDTGLAHRLGIAVDVGHGVGYVDVGLGVGARYAHEHDVGIGRYAEVCPPGAVRPGGYAGHMGAVGARRHIAAGGKYLPGLSQLAAVAEALGRRAPAVALLPHAPDAQLAGWRAEVGVGIVEPGVDYAHYHSPARERPGQAAAGLHEVGPDRRAHNVHHAGHGHGRLHIGHAGQRGRGLKRASGYARRGNVAAAQVDRGPEPLQGRDVGAGHEVDIGRHGGPGRGTGGRLARGKPGHEVAGCGREL